MSGAFQPSGLGVLTVIWLMVRVSPTSMPDRAIDFDRKQFDKEIDEIYVWPKVSRLINRYEPFVEADIGKCKQLLLEKVRELKDE